jgi:hypothetical protein
MPFLIRCKNNEFPQIQVDANTHFLGYFEMAITGKLQYQIIGWLYLIPASTALFTEKRVSSFLNLFVWRVMVGVMMFSGFI